MNTLVSSSDFGAFVGNLPPRTIIHVACKDGGYEVEYYPPPLPELIPSDELQTPRRFTYETDAHGCERMANARGKRNVEN